MNKIMEMAQAQKQYMTDMRRYFHMHPESSMQEYESTKKIVEELSAMGLSPKAMGEIGVLCDIKGAKPGKTIMLRADYDALEVVELNDIPYKSTVEGKMHACGHDGHAATLLGAAKILAQIKDELCGTVRLCFEPGEEIAKGALYMMEKGCLEGVDATFGIHLWSGIPSGKVSCEAGPRMASANWYKYHITGKPGHGAMPHQGVDAGLATASAMLALQSIVSRETSPMEPVVITVGHVISGTRFNVIAANSFLEGTTRCFNTKLFYELPAMMDRIVNDTAAAYRCVAEREETGSETPPVVNSEKCAAIAAEAVAKTAGPEHIATYPAQMVGEDFGYFMAKVPDSIFVFVGVGNEEKKTCEPHHSGRFNLDEEAFPVSAALYAQYAVDYLSK